jgi:hypothetical protein
MSVRSVAESRFATIAIPAWAVLLVTTVLAAVVHAALALRSPSPWIVPDEIIYSELAKSLGEGGLPRIRGEVSFAYGLGYPGLLAPVWAVFDNPATAYEVVKVVNAFVLALTAIPAYFLARRFVHEGYALLVSAFSVAIPSLVYAGTMLTEVALYPTFVLALLAIALALERPSPAAQVGAFGAIALASTVKMFASVLVPAFVAAILVRWWLERRENSIPRVSLRNYLPTWAALSVLAIAGTLVAAASRRSPFDLLGAYVVVLDNIDLGAMPWWALLHLAELDLYVAVIPFAATLVILWRCLNRVADAEERLFAALLLPCSVGVLAVVSAFASTPFPGGQAHPENVTRLHERSTFMLTPLLFLGLALWLRRRSGRIPIIYASVACAAAALLPALIPPESFGNVLVEALALEPWAGAWAGAWGVVAWPIGVLLFTLALGTLFLMGLRVRAHDAFFVLPIVLVLVTVSVSAQQSVQWASEHTRSVALGPSTSWIDEAVGGEGRVSVLWSERPGMPFAVFSNRHRGLWAGEFFNRSVGDVYEIGSPIPFGLPSTPVRLAGERVLLLDGRPAPLGELVLTPCHVRVRGAVIARDAVTGFSVVRVRKPLRVAVTEPGACVGGDEDGEPVPDGTYEANRSGGASAAPGSSWSTRKTVISSGARSASVQGSRSIR